jgi:hypothetical protein
VDGARPDERRLEDERRGGALELVYCANTRTKSCDDDATTLGTDEPKTAKRVEAR